MYRVYQYETKNVNRNLFKTKPTSLSYCEFGNDGLGINTSKFKMHTFEVFYFLFFTKDGRSVVRDSQDPIHIQQDGVCTQFP